jgi:hypothetical protein
MTRRGVMLTGLRGPLPVEQMVPWIDCHCNQENMLTTNFSARRRELFIPHINKINRAVRPAISCQDIN